MGIVENKETGFPSLQSEVIDVRHSERYNNKGKMPQYVNDMRSYINCLVSQKVAHDKPRRLYEYSHSSASCSQGTTINK